MSFLDNSYTYNNHQTYKRFQKEAFIVTCIMRYSLYVNYFNQCLLFSTTMSQPQSMDFILLKEILRKHLRGRALVFPIWDKASDPIDGKTRADSIVVGNFTILWEIDNMLSPPTCCRKTLSFWRIQIILFDIEVEYKRWAFHYTQHMYLFRLFYSHQFRQSLY